MPEATALSCGKCGAPLTVPGEVRYLACTFCGARLEVRREGGAAFTAVLERLADDVETVRLQNDLERLDREHDAALGLEDRPGGVGRLAATPRAAFAGVGLFIVLFGCVWIGASIAIGAPFFFPLFGAAFVALALLALRRGMRLQQRAVTLHAAYEQRRAELVARLDARRGARGADAP